MTAMSKSRRSLQPTRTAADQSTSDLDNAVTRLRRLGAHPDEVDAFVAGWDRFDGDWTPERQAGFKFLSDSDIAGDLAALRLEHHLGTHTEDEDDAALAATAEREVLGTVATVLAWVGDSTRNASAALAAEAAGRRRATLLTRLSELAGEPVPDPEPEAEGVDE